MTESVSCPTMSFSWSVSQLFNNRECFASAQESARNFEATLYGVVVSVRARKKIRKIANAECILFASQSVQIKTPQMRGAPHTCAAYGGAPGQLNELISSAFSHVHILAVRTWI